MGIWNGLRGGGNRFARLLALLAIALSVTVAAPRVALAAASLQNYAFQGYTPRGTTINLFDYWLVNRDTPDVDDPGDKYNIGINEGHVLKFRSSGNRNVDADITNSSSVNEYTGTNEPRQGIVESTLGADGYPRLSSQVLSRGQDQESLRYLFDPAVENDGKESFGDVGGLLQVDENGYYYYDSTKNYAEFDEEENSFWLYGKPAVTNSGGAQGRNGQFFPFDKGSEVLHWSWADDSLVSSGVNSNSSDLNHFFGMSMSTNFVQQYGGHTDATGLTPVTYNFSGDDDVWIYIDDVLVGDLGGIHGASSIQIDFSDGSIVVYRDANADNQYDRGDQEYYTTDLRTQFENAGKGSSIASNSNTLKDNTYHTLNFFYLERGGTDSNMSLRYNLKTIPETDITKVDQDAQPVSGAQFEVRDGITGEVICSATTDNDGSVVLLDGEDKPITIEDLYNAGHMQLTFVETATPSGYREAGDGMPISARIEQVTETENEKTVYLLLSSNQWETGAYAQAKATVTATNEIELENGRTLTENEKKNGRMFAVVEKRIDGKWIPIYGDALNGWHRAEDDTMTSIVQAGEATNSVFVIASSGAYETEVSDLPGRIQDYAFFNGWKEGNGTYRCAYYWSEESSWDDMNEGNTSKIKSDSFDRQFSANLYITNINNRVVLQKVDESGDPVNGATMALYKVGDVEVAADGTKSIIEGANPVEKGTTSTLSKDAGDKINLDGAVVFDRLDEGVYYAAEIEAPDGFVKTDDLAKVIVTGSGVYADAGTEDDDVTVTRGIGRVLGSMLQFAADDEVDTTLHDVVATPQIGSEENGELVTWTPAGQEDLHLQYAADSDSILDYEPEEEGEDQSFTVKSGIPGLKVEQCQDHKDNEKAQDLNGQDLTNLFTGSTIVTLKNERRASLEITKQLTMDEGLVGPSSLSYQMKVTLSGSNLDENEITAKVFDSDETLVGKEFEFKLTDNGDGTYSRGQEIEAGQTLCVYGLPDGTRYTVTEDTTGEHELPRWVKFSGISLEGDQDASSATSLDGVVHASEEPARIVVTNAYDPDPAGLPTGETGVSVIKNVVNGTGEEMSPEGYTFDIAIENVSEGADSDSGFTLPAPAVGTSSEDGTVSFGGIKFDAVGTYEVTITEQPGHENMVYDGHSLVYKVKVTDPGDGELAAEVDESTIEGETTFTNVYYDPDDAKSVESENGDGSMAGVGETLTYTIDWASNALDENGNPAPATITIEDTIPEGAKFKNASDGGAYDEATRTVTWELGEKDYGDHGSVTLEVEVEASAAGSDLTNTAQVLVNNSSIQTNPVTTTVPGKEMAQKEDDADGIQVGDVLTYTIDYANKTDGPATVIVTDPLPTGLAYVGVPEGAPEPEQSGQTLVWTLQDVPAGSKGSISFTARVTEAALSADDTVDNTATVQVGENTYKTNVVEMAKPATGDLRIEKDVVALNGAEVNSDTSFSFTVSLTDTSGYDLTGSYKANVYDSNDQQTGAADFIVSGVDDQTTTDRVENTFTLKDGEYIVISGLPDGAAYDVEETSAGSGYTTEEKNTSGLIPIGEDDAAGTFTNVYTPGEVSLGEGTNNPIQVTKVVEGASALEDFNFSIALAGDNKGPENGVTLPTDRSATVHESDLQLEDGATTATASANFGTITFTKTGTYTFTIDETTPTPSPADGWAYDEGTRAVTVQVGYDADSGNLKIESVQYHGADGANAESATFTNRYTVNGVATIDGSTNLSGTKTLSGRDWTSDDSFTFELTSGDEDTQRAIDDGAIQLPDTTVKVQGGDADGNPVSFSFGDIEFSKAGVYTFKISEVMPTDDDSSTEGVQKDGVTYDGHSRIIKVTVADNGRGGLVATAASEGSASWTNTYSPGTATLNGSDNLMVSKVISGRDWQDGDSFTFVLTADKNNPEGAVLPQNASGIKIDDETAEHKAAFGDITFTKDGNYTFYVTEQAPDDEEKLDGMTYDNSVHVIQVSVVDDGKGTLTATPSITSQNNLTFTNVYYDPEDAKDVAAADQPETSIDGEMVGVGDKVTYTIDWANNDQSAPTGTVVITDTVPTGVTVGDDISAPGELSEDGKSITWTFDNVAYGTTGKVSFTATVNASAADEAVENSATVKVGENAYTTNTVTNPVPGKRETSQPAKIGEGTVLTYEITFVNTDGDDATAKVVDSLTKGQKYNAGSAEVGGQKVEPTVEGDAATGQTLTWNLENLEADAEVTLTFKVTVTRDAGVSVDNTATVNGHRTNTTTTPYPSDDKKDVFEADDPTTSVDGKLVGVGDTLTYVIDWAANVDGDVTITDTLPTGIELIEDTIDEPGAYDPSTRTITWNLGHKAAGDKGSVQFDATVTDDAVSTDNTKNSATVKVGENDPKVTNEVTVVVPEKSVDDNNDHADGEIQVGDRLTYTIEVPNTTGVDADMSITDVVPSGVTVDEETIDQDGAYDADSNTITWNIRVGANATGRVSFTGVVNESAIDQEIDNQATVKIGDNEFKTNTVPGEVSSGDLTISKTVELASDQGVQIDDARLFEFTLDMKNTGQENLASQYAITGAYGVNGNAITEVTNGSKIYLHSNDTATIKGLPAGATVTATEMAADGYTPQGGAEKSAGIEAGQTAAIQFVNVYDVNEFNGVPAGFKLTKVFDGHEWTGDYSFKFAMTGVDEAGNPAPLPKADEAAGVTVEGSTAYKTVTGPQPSGAADFNFGAITYTKAGTYTYTVSEVEPAGAERNPGIDYSNAEAKVVVEVTDRDQSGSATGKLVATATVEDSATFTNTYETDDVDYDAAAGLQIVKTMTGHAIGAGDFTFTMTGVGEESIARLNNGSPLAPFSTEGALLGTGADANHATETIDVKTGLVFTQGDAGKTYTYEVKEVNGGKSGVEYDATVYRVQFNVIDDGNGTLSVETLVDGTSRGTVTSSNATAPTPVKLSFQNSYDAGQVTVGANGSAQITGTKTLANDDIAGYNFTFSVKSGNVLVTTGSNNGTGTITFNDIVYNTENLNMAASDAGSPEVGKANKTSENGVDTYTFSYTVSEDAPTAGSGVTANSDVQYVTVVVTDNGEGNLSAAVTYDQGDLKFENTYGGSANFPLTITGNKKIEGAQGLNVPTIEDGMFGFDIVGSPAKDGTPAPMPETTHVENEGAAVSFGPITYTMENVFGNSGTPAIDETSAIDGLSDEGVEAEPVKRTKKFTYTITESASKTVPGVTNDVSRKTVEVTVTDNRDGTVKAEVTSAKTEDESDFTFTNTYSVETETSSLTGDGGFTITKTLNSNTGRQLADGEFTFRLVGQDGSVTDATNRADGSVSFGGITFGAPGTYKYTLSEVKGGAAGMDYSSKSYNVTAQVDDNGDGTLGVTWSIEGVEAGGNVAFVNEYEADPASIVFGAIKTLDGREMKEGEFTFQLTDQAGNVLEATNKADGSVVFPTVSYDKPGTYTYTVTEKLPEDDDASTEGVQKDGVTYDQTKWTATVNVTDNTETGCLSATVDYGNGEKLAEFHNVYVKPAEPVQPEGPKEQMPQTGDRSIFIVAALAGIGAVLAVTGYVASKRRGE